jgi:hypothetical protein
MRGDGTPYGVLAGMIGYRAELLPWTRLTRLRVTEFLTDTPMYLIRSSKDIPEATIRDVLDSIHPDWSQTTYHPTPEATDKQLRALCILFNKDIVRLIGRPQDYATEMEVEQASKHLYEVTP